MAMVATERKNGNGTTEYHNGTTERQNRMAKRQQQNRNGIVETRHKPPGIGPACQSCWSVRVTVYMTTAKLSATAAHHRRFLDAAAEYVRQQSAATVWQHYACSVNLVMGYTLNQYVLSEELATC